MMTGTKFDIEKFDGKNDFGLWQVRMKALLEHQGLATALEELHATTIMAYDNVIQKKAYSALIFCLVGRDLAAIDSVISDDDHALFLLTSLPSSYDNFMETFLYGQDTLKLEDVLVTLNSRETQKMTEAKGDGGEGLYVRGRSGRRDMKRDTDNAWSKSQGRSSRLKCYICQSEEHLKRDCSRYNHKKSQGFFRNEDQVSSSGPDEYDSADVMMAIGVDELLDWIMDLGKLDSVEDQNRDTTADWSGLSKIFWAEDTTMSTYLVNKSPSLAIGFKMPVDMLGNMGFNESGKYKKTFICSCVGTGSVQVLQGVEFKVESQEDHAFEVEPLRNVGQEASSQKVTKGLLDEAKGNIIVSLKSSLSGDYDMEKNDVGMLDGFDRGLQTDVQVFVDFDYAIGRSITWYGLMIQGCTMSWEAILQHMEALLTTEAVYIIIMEAEKEAISLKGLSADT
ncbi:zinc finger, CCHC-type containing protein [Tanacetum coccineum]